MWFEVRTPDRSDLFLHFRQSPSPASFWLKYKITVVCAWLALFAWLFHFGPAVRAWAEFWRFVTVQGRVAELAKTAIDFPPMQDPASFNLDAVKKQIDDMIKAHQGE